MKQNNFVHLHSHTQYSLLDGACLLTELVKLAQLYNMPALAITDHGNMFGAVEFYQLCMKAGIKPIIGCEAYIAPNSRFDKSTQGVHEAAYHLVLLAKDEDGYRNLIKLVSIGYLEGFYYKPRIDREVLRQHSKGLICLSACLKGEVAHFIQSNQLEQAYKIAGEYSEIFGKDRFYLEMHDHNMPEQKQVNKVLLKMSKDLTLDLVATNDFHYLQKAHSEAHEALLCIQTQTNLDDPKRMRLSTDEFYFKTADEMRKVFAEVPSALDNTLKIADMCDLKLDLKSIHLPHFSPPEKKTREGFLKELVEEGLQKRYTHISSSIRSRVEHEIKSIEHSGFVSYFLIVWDFIRYAKEQKIPVGPGRGCFTPETKILMGDLSVKDIKDIRKGEYVISHLGKRRKVKDVFRYEINEEIAVISSKMPTRKLRLTKNHKVPLIKHKMCNVKSIKPTICKPSCPRYCKNKLWQKYKLQWKRADEIQRNDFLLFPVYKTTGKNKIYDLAGFIKDKNFKYDKKFVWYSIGSNRLVRIKIKRFLELDASLAKLIGYYISEGYVRTRTREATIGFGFHINETDKQNEAAGLLKDIFGLKATIKKHKYKKSAQVLAYSKIAALFFKELCGRYSNDRRIPVQLFSSPSNVKTALLTGLFKGDGSYKEPMRVSYDSISYQLVLQIKCLLSQLGIMSSIHKRVHKKINWNISYKLRISGAQLFRLNNIFKEIPIRIKVQKFYRNDTFVDRDYIYFPVKNIEFKNYKGDVHDLSVDVDKTYVANEVVVHNSAAGSVVSYALGITDLDPLRYGLLFERFLNPERVSLPDIDIDFCYERRDEVIDYVKRKYGSENVAQIITFGTMLAKAAIRDVARVMNFSYSDADRIAKLVPTDLNITLAQALEQEPELMQMYKNDPRVTRLIDIARVLEGVTRHASTHAAGVVISEKGLTNHVPLFKTGDDQITTGYPMNSLEKIGLLKMDFLGLKTLTVINETIKIIKRT
ncbi:MAG: DNA polymerase III subunit alpha, partial [Candidatus Omnitrophota bacterium]